MDSRKKMIWRKLLPISPLVAGAIYFAGFTYYQGATMDIQHSLEHKAFFWSWKSDDERQFMKSEETNIFADFAERALAAGDTTGMAAAKEQVNTLRNACYSRINTYSAKADSFKTILNAHAYNLYNPWLSWANLFK